MRRALDGNPFISTVFAEPGYGYFGKHAGYDYGVKEWTVKAPEAGVITNVRIAPNLDGGNIVELRSDKYDHRFLHLSSASVSKGQVVSEGQELGISGKTGNVGYHLHHDVRKKGTLWTDSFDNYYDWEQLIKQGGTIMPDDGTIINIFQAINDRPATDSEIAAYRNKDINNPNGIVYNKMLVDIRNLKQMIADMQKEAGYEPVTEQLFKKKG